MSELHEHLLTVLGLLAYPPYLPLGLVVPTSIAAWICVVDRRRAPRPRHLRWSAWLAGVVIVLVADLMLALLRTGTDGVRPVILLTAWLIWPVGVLAWTLRAPNHDDAAQRAE